MTIIESETVVNQPIESIYHFLQDYNNHQRLMPPDVKNWKSTNDEASFTVQDIITLSLRIAERIENALIIIVPVDKTPLNIKLGWKLEAMDRESTKVKYYIHADLNMMMKMVAKGPLKKLIEYQVTRLKQTLE